MPFSELRSKRPVGQAKVHEVEGGLHQGRCVCRWHGRRHRDVTAADTETATHVASCGRCIAEGRAYMDACSCANCQRRRIVRNGNGEGT